MTDDLTEAVTAAIIETITRRNCSIIGKPYHPEQNDEFDHVVAHEHAKAAIAAMQPHIEAERGAAAKAALEAAAQDAETWFPFDTNKKYKSFGVVASIRAIDPAQFRSDRDGQ